MPAFRNQPTLRTENGEHKIKRFVHSPIEVEHYGINASISRNGKVTLTKVARAVGEQVEYDEIEIPASLVFKLANLLTITRKVEYVAIGDAIATNNAETQEG